MSNTLYLLPASVLLAFLPSEGVNTLADLSWALVKVQP